MLWQVLFQAMIMLMRLVVYYHCKGKLQVSLGFLLLSVRAFSKLLSRDDLGPDYPTILCTSLHPNMPDVFHYANDR